MSDQQKPLSTLQQQEQHKIPLPQTTSSQASGQDVNDSEQQLVDQTIRQRNQAAFQTDIQNGVSKQPSQQVFSIGGQFARRETRTKKDLNYIKDQFKQNSHFMSIYQNQIGQEAIDEQNLLLQPQKSFQRRRSTQNNRSYEQHGPFIETKGLRLSYTKLPTTDHPVDNNNRFSTTLIDQAITATAVKDDDYTDMVIKNMQIPQMIDNNSNSQQSSQEEGILKIDVVQKSKTNKNQQPVFKSISIKSPNQGAQQISNLQNQLLTPVLKQQSSNTDQQRSQIFLRSSIEKLERQQYLSTNYLGLKQKQDIQSGLVLTSVPKELNMRIQKNKSDASVQADFCEDQMEQKLITTQPLVDLNPEDDEGEEKNELDEQDSSRTNHDTNDAYDKNYNDMKANLNLLRHSRQVQSGELAQINPISNNIAGDGILLKIQQDNSYEDENFHQKQFTNTTSAQQQPITQRLQSKVIKITNNNIKLGVDEKSSISSSYQIEITNTNNNNKLGITQTDESMNPHNMDPKMENDGSSMLDPTAINNYNSGASQASKQCKSIFSYETPALKVNSTKNKDNYTIKLSSPKNQKSNSSKSQKKRKASKSKTKGSAAKLSNNYNNNDTETPPDDLNKKLQEQLQTQFGSRRSTLVQQQETAKMKQILELNKDINSSETFVPDEQRSDDPRKILKTVSSGQIKIRVEPPHIVSRNIRVSNSSNHNNLIQGLADQRYQKTFNQQIQRGLADSKSSDQQLLDDSSAEYQRQFEKDQPFLAEIQESEYMIEQQKNKQSLLKNRHIINDNQIQMSHTSSQSKNNRTRNYGDSKSKKKNKERPKINTKKVDAYFDSHQRRFLASQSPNHNQSLLSDTSHYHLQTGSELQLQLYHDSDSHQPYQEVNSNKKPKGASFNIDQIRVIMSERKINGVDVDSYENNEHHQSRSLSQEGIYLADQDHKHQIQVVIGDQKKKRRPFQTGQPQKEEFEDQEQHRKWKDLVKDEFNLIKCPQNSFGSKAYKLTFDKSTLSEHVNKILKSNLELIQNKRPYLIKQSSIHNLSQDMNSIKKTQSPAHQDLSKSPDTSTYMHKQIIQQQDLQQKPQLIKMVDRQLNGGNTTGGGSNTHLRSLERNQNQEPVSRANKLSVVGGPNPRDYKVRGPQFRSRKEPLDDDDLPQPKINSTTMAQWLRHCSPEAIHAQILKLQALRIDKLNIDYKLVDKSVDERPYIVSEDEQDLYDELADESLQNFDCHMVLGPQKDLELSDIASTTKQDRKNSRIERVRESRNTRKGITLSEQRDGKMELSSITSGQFATSQLPHGEVNQAIKTNQSLSNSNVRLSQNNFGNEISHTEGRANLADSTQKLAQLRRKVIGQRSRQLHQHHMRTKLPISPAFSYLKSAPSEHFLKLNRLTKKVQKQAPHEFFNQSRQVGQLANKKFLRREPEDYNQQTTLLRKDEQNNNPSMMSSGLINIQRQSKLNAQSPRSIGSGGAASSMASSGKKNKNIQDGQLDLALLPTSQQQKIDSNSQDIFGYYNDEKLMTEIVNSNDSKQDSRRVKNSFRSFNNQNHEKNQPILQPSNSSFNRKSNRMQYQMSTQLVRDASVKFIAGMEDDRIISSPRSSSNQQLASEPRKEYESIKFVYKQPQTQPQVLLKPVQSNFELIRLNQSSKNGERQLSEDKLSISAWEDQSKPNYKQQNANYQRNQQIKESSAGFGSTQRQYQLLIQQKPDQIQSQKQSQRSTQTKQKAFKKVDEKSRIKAEFDSIKQKNFTPGLDSHTESSTRAHGFKSQNKIKAIQKQTKQVQNAYFPMII